MTDEIGPTARGLILSILAINTRIKLFLLVFFSHSRIERHVWEILLHTIYVLNKGREAMYVCIIY